MCQEVMVSNGANDRGGSKVRIMWSKQEEKSDSDLSKETGPTAAVDQRRGHERLLGRRLLEENNSYT